VSIRAERTAADAARPEAPFIRTSRTKGEAYLIIPDTQDPYAAPGWLSFARAVAAEEGVDVNEPGRVLHTGDEADQYHASMFDHDPDSPHTPKGELRAYRERVAETAAVFPHMLLAASNHGDRWKKRALHCGFPAELFRLWAEVIGAPPGWRWDRKWRIPASKRPFLLEHGDWGAQGLNGTRQRVLDNGIPTAHGHQHSTAAVVWVATIHRPQEWGMNAACLIDVDAKAFDYGRASRFQPTRGIGAVRDGGRMPVWYPYGGTWP